MNTEDYIRIIENAAPLSLEKIIQLEVSTWEASRERRLIVLGDQYYRADHEVLNKTRREITRDGRTMENSTLANKKLVHAFLRKLVDQKTGYLLAKQPSIQTDSKEYYEELKSVLLDKRFLKLLKNIGKDAVKAARGWMHPYYNEKGVLSFKRIPPLEAIPLWKDADHTELDAFIRVYEIEVYEADRKRIVRKIEYWDKSGVKRYTDDPLNPAGLTLDESTYHFSVLEGEKEVGMNWERVPFICFKYNDDEIPLIKFVKSLIDDYDEQHSDNANNITDMPNGIYVLTNYDGTDLGDFRENLSKYRAIKVSGDGKVNTLTLDLKPEALEKHADQLRKDIYEFGRGVDTQSEKFGNSPSGIALKFLYADLDMDANEMETEFQSALDDLMFFIDADIYNRTNVDYEEESVDFIFNRDILINETEAVTNAKDSVGVISDKTIMSNHPWVTDTGAEAEQLKKEQEEAAARMPAYPGLEDPVPATGGDEE